MSSLETLLVVERQRIMRRALIVFYGSLVVAIGGLCGTVAIYVYNATAPITALSVLFGSILIFVGLLFVGLIVVGPMVATKIGDATETIQRGAADHVGRVLFVQFRICMPTFHPCKKDEYELGMPAHLRISLEWPKLTM